MSASSNSVGQATLSVTNGVNEAPFTVIVNRVLALGELFMFTCQAGHSDISVQSSYFLIDNDGKPNIKGTASNAGGASQNLYFNWMIIPTVID